MNRRIFFFIGTEAELIKMFPVILECRGRKLPCGLIASGQNDIRHSKLLEEIGTDMPSLYLSDESSITKSAAGLLSWFVRTSACAEKRIRRVLKGVNLMNSVMVVHGDTISTLMGAYLGRRMRMQVCHVEAGLRSHHLLNPFPEEIDRLLTGRLAGYHFAPGDEPCRNLRNAKGEVINTGYNTIIDSLRYAIRLNQESDIPKEPYFVFVLHRQENLMNRRLTGNIVRTVLKAAAHMKCVLLLHEITRIQFEKYGLMEAIERNPNILRKPRMEYFAFMKLLYRSEFVLTDGGSNQEELHYMGKPCLILRGRTERREGLGSNAQLYDEDAGSIFRFARNYKQFRIPSKLDEAASPGRIIAGRLAEILRDGKQ